MPTLPYISSMEQDLIGCTFGRWHVVSFAFVKAPHKYFNCRCDCGTERTVQGPSLTQGTTKSCGCFRRERSKERHTTHGACGHPGYASWAAMRVRCGNKKGEHYRHYGGRGIKVCGRWQTFQGFWEDMGPTWAPGLSLDRIDVNGSYIPENCRWATATQQAQNKRTNLVVETPWGPLTQSEAARRAGISVGCLKNRIHAGWPAETLFLPPSYTRKVIPHAD